MALECIQEELREGDGRHDELALDFAPDTLFYRKEPIAIVSRKLEAVVWRAGLRSFFPELKPEELDHRLRTKLLE